MSATSLLPSFDAREKLLDGLAVVGKRVGWDAFLANPLLTPEPRWFPDAWTPDRRGVRRLALRILRYAGLACSVVVEVEEPESEGAVAWFSGFRGDTCFFGIDPAHLTHDETFVAALCHEACHAFRQHHGLVGREMDREEEATDLTCVFVGFGTLVLNASDQVDVSGEILGYTVRTRFRVQRLGYLSPLALAYLLAVQCTVRRLDRAAVKRLASYLRTPQRDYFEAAMKELADDGALLRGRLGVPDPSTWPAVRDTPLTEDLDDQDPPSEASPETVVEAPTPSRAGPVLRVTDSDACSACDGRIERGEKACVTCGGEVIAEVADNGERFALEELLEDHGIDEALALHRAAYRAARRASWLGIAKMLVGVVVFVAAVVGYAVLAHGR